MAHNSGYKEEYPQLKSTKASTSFGAGGLLAPWQVELTIGA